MKIWWHQELSISANIALLAHNWKWQFIQRFVCTVENSETHHQIELEILCNTKELYIRREKFLNGRYIPCMPSDNKKPERLYAQNIKINFQTISTAFDVDNA